MLKLTILVNSEIIRWPGGSPMGVTEMVIIISSLNNFNVLIF